MPDADGFEPGFEVLLFFVSLGQPANAAVATLLGFFCRNRLQLVAVALMLPLLSKAAADFYWVGHFRISEIWRSCPHVALAALVWASTAFTLKRHLRG